LLSNKASRPLGCISIVLPTYNEAGNIEVLIGELLHALGEDHDLEIVVVDDDSPDETRTRVKMHFSADPRVHLVHRRSNRGLAASIWDGILQSSGDHVVVMDSDLTHDPAELPRMLHVAQAFDLVIGSRFCEGGSMGSRPHYLASLTYNWGLRAILRTQIQDNLGGYWIMTRSNLANLPLERVFFGYGDYFFRLLRYAELYGLSVVEVPSVYRSRGSGSSKSQFFKLILTYSMEAFRLQQQLRRTAPPGA
jgi:dolichol-phosphate mannosyltransferase